MTRRLLLPLGLVLAVIVLLVVSIPARSQDPDSGGGKDTGQEGKVDVIFDTAKGIVPGQVVKIAGAKVGEVTDVSLTDDYQARLELQVSSDFTPFRQDARCEIQPEGLISENFVQCDPGSPDAPPLEAKDGEAPTVPVERTSVPVNLTDLFEIWNVPTRDRLRVLLNTLGAGVAARGPDINRLIRRANPTLGLVRQATGLLDGQRDALKAAVVQAQQLTGELAKRPEDLQSTITESAKLTQTLSERRKQLSAGLEALPPALASVRPALVQLRSFAEQGAPLARRIGAAAPQVDSLLKQIPPAAKQALPAVRALGKTAQDARPVVSSARPLVKQLNTFARRALPVGRKLAPLLTNMRQRGFTENLLSFVYYATAATSRYDAISHIIAIHANASTCGVATDTRPDCDANYVRNGAEVAQSRGAKEKAEKTTTAADEATPGRGGADEPSASDDAPATTGEKKPGLVPDLPIPLPKLTTPDVPDVPVAPQADDAAESVLDFLLSS